MTPEQWSTSYAAHGRRSETMQQFRARIVQQARDRGLVEHGGYWYRPDDQHHRHPLSPSGSPTTTPKPRVEQHSTSRPGAGRADQLATGGGSRRSQKLATTAERRQTRSGWKWVTLPSGRRVQVKVTTAHEQYKGRHR